MDRHLALFAAFALCACQTGDPAPPACAAFPQAIVTAHGESEDGDTIEFDGLWVSIDGGEFEAVTCEPGQCTDVAILDAEGAVTIRGGWSGETAEASTVNERSSDGCSIPNPTVTLVFPIPEEGCRNDDDDSADGDDDDPCR